MSPLDRMRSFDGFHACKSLRFHLCVVGSQSWRQDFYVMILGEVSKLIFLWNFDHGRNVGSECIACVGDDDGH